MSSLNVDYVRLFTKIKEELNSLSKKYTFLDILMFHFQKNKSVFKPFERSKDKKLKY